jgi:four helix bundle protein
MKSHKDLIVWQKSMVLAKETYILIRKLPPEERFALADQMRRAVVSIPSNIAEGYGRNTTKEYSHFLSISLGSLNELETQFLLCKDLGYFEYEQLKTVFSLINEVKRMLVVMIKKNNESE